MFAEILGRARHPKAGSPSGILLVGVSVLRMAALGIFFRRPHQLLPPTVQIASTGFCVASVMFFAAGALRDSILSTKPLQAFMANAMSYCILLLVSIAGWVPEFTLLLCVSVGIDLVASCLALTGIIESNGGVARSLLIVWELAAAFTAMVQLRLSRLPPGTS